MYIKRHHKQNGGKKTPSVVKLIVAAYISSPCSLRYCMMLVCSCFFLQHWQKRLKLTLSLPFWRHIQCSRPVPLTIHQSSLGCPPKKPLCFYFVSFFFFPPFRFDSTPSRRMYFHWARHGTAGENPPPPPPPPALPRCCRCYCCSQRSQRGTHGLERQPSEMPISMHGPNWTPWKSLGKICEIVPEHTEGDEVTRRPICWGMTSCVVPHDLQLRVWSRDECATVRGRPLRYYAIVPPNICPFLSFLSGFTPRQNLHLWRVFPCKGNR